MSEKCQEGAFCIDEDCEKKHPVSWNLYNFKDKIRIKKPSREIMPGIPENSPVEYDLPVDYDLDNIDKEEFSRRLDRVLKELIANPSIINDHFEGRMSLAVPFIIQHLKKEMINENRSLKTRIKSLEKELWKKTKKYYK